MGRRTGGADALARGRGGLPRGKRHDSGTRAKGGQPSRSLDGPTAGRMRGGAQTPVAKAAPTPLTARAMTSPDLPVAILAGGLATRLRPITEKVPKLLVEVAGEPFFSHQLRLLHAACLRRLVLCVGKFFTREEVAGIREGGDPASILAAGMPPTVIQMQVGAEDIINFRRMHTRCCQIGKPGRIIASRPAFEARG